MTKQEFLAMSLPYNLKIKHFDANRESEHICKIEVWYNEEVTILDGEHEYDLLLNDILPILRPLSDLIKPIEHKGEKFVPIERLNELLPYGTKSFGFAFEFDSRGVFGLLTPNSWLPFINYFPAMLKLIEWHFDIADLISKGEAIDVNTLDINPYK